MRPQYTLTDCQYGVYGRCVEPALHGYLQCATKAFNLAFSEAQRLAVESLGFVIGSVDTPSAPKDSQGNILVMEPREMAKACLDRCGCGQWILEGIWSHWALGIFLKVVPEFIMVGKVKDLYLKQKKGR